MSAILICGDSMTDEYWYGEVERISPEAPVPCLRITRNESRFGAADNVAANCKALGAEIYPVTCHTAKKIRVVGRSQQIVRIDFDYGAEPDAVAKLELDFLTAVPKCKYVIFSDYGKGSLVHVQALIQAAKGSGATVLVDPKGHDYTRYAGADCIKPNVPEMKEMVGGWRDEAQLEAKAMHLLESTGIARLLLTRGADGMSLFGDGEPLYYPAAAQEVYDVTGAGDTAIACMAVALSRGNAWGEAVRYANKAAGLAVGHFGTAVITEKEVFNETA